jgi:hypothetical protein
MPLLHEIDQPPPEIRRKTARHDPRPPKVNHTERSLGITDDAWAGGRVRLSRGAAYTSITGKVGDNPDNAAQPAVPGGAGCCHSKQHSDQRVCASGAGQAMSRSPGFEWLPAFTLSPRQAAIAGNGHRAQGSLCPSPTIHVRQAAGCVG